MEGWPSQTFFNFEYQVMQLTDTAFAFVKAADGNTTQTVGELIAATGADFATVRQLQTAQVILLTPRDH
jgi:hypothetical protein